MRSGYCYLAFTFAFAISFIGCVPSGKFKAMQQQAHLSDSLYTQSMRTLKACQDDNASLGRQRSTLQEKAKDLNTQLTAANEVNGQLRKQMQELSAVSSAQAESIRRSLDDMGARDTYMIALHAAVTYRDSVNLAVLLNLKQALGGFGDRDIDVRLDKGMVHVDLSDSFLFSGDSSSYAVTDQARTMLGRLARALNDQPDVQFMVVGRCDSLATTPDSLHDTWNLSVQRATALVRILQNDQVSPSRMTAAGRTSILPMNAADTTTTVAAGRTRIIILPQMDRLLELLDRGRGQAAPSAPPQPPTVSGS